MHARHVARFDLIGSSSAWNLVLEVAQKPLDIFRGLSAIERAHAFDKLFVSQFGFSGRHAHEDMEMVAHEAVSEHLNPGKRLKSDASGSRTYPLQESHPRSS